jgi:hypothetical protein
MINYVNIRLVWLAWTGPQALAHNSCTGWDTCPAWLAPLPMIAFAVLLDPTWVHQSLLALIITVENYYAINTKYSR